MKAPLLAAATGLLATIGFSAGAPLPAELPRELVTLNGHEDTVVSLAFSPDGKLLASAGRFDGTARLWDLASGQCLHVLKGHLPRAGNRAFVRGVAFSPDGKTLATGGDDDTVRFWDVANGKEVSFLRVGCSPHALLFSPDGKMLAVNDGDIHLWDVAAGKERAVLKVVCPTAPVFTFTSTGKLLAAGKDYEPPTFSLWDGDTGQKTLTFKGHPKADHPKGTAGLAISPDGKMVASCGFDQVVRLWDSASGRELGAFDQRPGWPMALRFNPDGTILAVAYLQDLERRSKLATIRLLAIPSGKLLAAIEDQEGLLSPFVFSPDGRFLASGCGGNRIKVWRLPAHWEPEK
jgi:WD40 repeat protein